MLLCVHCGCCKMPVARLLDIAYVPRSHNTTYDVYTVFNLFGLYNCACALELGMQIQ